MSKIKIVENMIRKIIKEESKKVDYSTSVYYDARRGKQRTTGNSKKDSIISAIDDISNSDESLVDELISIIPDKYDVYDSWPESLWNRVERFLKSKGKL